MSLLRVSALVILASLSEVSRCQSVVRALVPVSPSRACGIVNEESHPLTIDGAKYDFSCTCGSCRSCVDCEQIIMKLVNALIAATKQTPHNHSGCTGPSDGGPKPTLGQLIDIGLLQQGANGGLDVLNLGLLGQWLLSLNLGGTAGDSQSQPSPSPCSSTPNSPCSQNPSNPPTAPSTPSKGGLSDLIKVGVLQQDPSSGGLSVANVDLGNIGVIDAVLGGVNSK